MFDKVSKKLAEKMGKTVQETVKETAIPIKNELTQAASNKVDLWSHLLKFGVLIILFIEGTKKVTNLSPSNEGPNHIIINNYLMKDPKDKGGSN